MKTLFSICCIALLGVSVSSRGKGLSDLEEFARSPQSIAKVFSDVATKQKYRRALETYTGRAVPLRDFDATWEKLRRLYTELDGVKGRLASDRQPLSFSYKPEKDTYRFERVNHPLHAIWLLQNLREPNTDSCTQRDNLLADRWTPMLNDAALFSIEKNGVYTGATLTLVPVQSGAISYLLVVPSDSGAKLSEHLMEAFLRDYRKKNPESLRFALLTKDPRSKLAYRIEKVDDQGRRASRLGPVEGFHLIDPMAKKMLTFAPSDCGGGSRSSIAKSNTSIDPIGSALGEGGVGSDTNISFNANAQANANPVVGGDSGGAAGGLRNPMSGSGVGGAIGGLGSQGGNVGLGSSPSGGGNNTNITNNNDNRVLTPKYRKPSSPEFAVSGKVPAQQQQQQQWQPQIQNFSPQVIRESAGSSGGGDRGSAPAPVISVSTPGSSGGVTVLSPNDQKFKSAVDEARRAMKEGRKIPREAYRDALRGARLAENPEVRREAEQISVDGYFKNLDADVALEELANDIDSDPKRQNSQLLSRFHDEFCRQCPDCEGCEDIRRDLGVKEGAVLR